MKSQKRILEDLGYTQQEAKKALREKKSSKKAEKKETVKFINYQQDLEHALLCIEYIKGALLGYLNGSPLLDYQESLKFLQEISKGSNNWSSLDKFLFKLEAFELAFELCENKNTIAVLAERTVNSADLALEFNPVR